MRTTVRDRKPTSIIIAAVVTFLVALPRVLTTLAAALGMEDAPGTPRYSGIWLIVAGASLVLVGIASSVALLTFPPQRPAKVAWALALLANGVSAGVSITGLGFIAPLLELVSNSEVAPNFSNDTNWAFFLIWLGIGGGPIGLLLLAPIIALLRPSARAAIGLRGRR